MKELATRLLRRRRRIFNYFFNIEGMEIKWVKPRPLTQHWSLTVQIVVEGFVGNNNDSFLFFFEIFVDKIELKHFNIDTGKIFSKATFSKKWISPIWTTFWTIPKKIILKQ